MEQLQFVPASSYGCWYAPCRDMPSQQLVPNKLFRIQQGTYVDPKTDANLSCGAVCMMSRENETIIYPPMAGGDVQIGGMVMECGGNIKQSVVMPGLPVKLAMPLNASAIFQVPLSNVGSDPIFARYDPTVGDTWAAIEPDAFFLTAGINQPVQLVLNKNNLGTLTNVVYLGSVSFVWNQIVGTEALVNREWISFEVMVLPPVPAIQQVNIVEDKRETTYIYILAAAVILLFLIGLIFFARRYSSQSQPEIVMPQVRLTDAQRSALKMQRLEQAVGQEGIQALAQKYGS